MPHAVPALLASQPQNATMFTNSHCSRDTHVMYEDLRQALRFGAKGAAEGAPRGAGEGARGGIVKL